MTDPSPAFIPPPGRCITETTAALIAELQRLAVTCPGEIATATAQRTEAEADAARLHERSIAAATEKFLDRTRATEHTAALKRKSLLREQDALVQEAEAARDKAVATFEAGTRELAGRASKELEEGEWLSETLVEAGDRKADLEVGTLRTTLIARQKQLDEARERANQVLTRMGYSPLPPPPTDAPSPAEPEQAYADAAKAIEHTRVIADSPTGSRVLVVIAGLAVTLGIAAYFALNKRPTSDILIWSLAGGIGTLVLLFAIQQLFFRSRIPKAASHASAFVAQFAAAAASRLADVESTTQESKRSLRSKRNGEITKLRADHESIRSTIERRRSIAGPSLLHEQTSSVKAAIAARDEAIASFDARVKTKLAAITAEREHVTAEADQVRQTVLTSSRAAHTQVVQSIQSQWDSFTATWARQSAELAAASTQAAPPWPTLDNADFSQTDGVPTFIPFGLLRPNPHAIAQAAGSGNESAYIDRVPTQTDLPIALEFTGRGSLLVRHTPARRADAMRLLNQVMLRIITAIPPAKARFTIIDPVGLGQGFSAFMHLADADPLLVSDKIWTEPRHIEQKLGDLTEHMENVIQKYLRNQYPTIADYNEAAGEVAEPLRFLVIADFPTNLTDVAASRLASIVSAGAKCGVFTLIAADFAAKGPSQLPIAEVERTSLPIILNDSTSLALDPFRTLPLVLDEPPAEDRITDMLAKIGQAAKESGRVQVPFDTVAPTADREWTSDASQELSVPIGRAGARKLQRLTLGRGTAQHALIAGRTGSGKSTLFHVIITNLAMWYSPREVELYLIDFKKGVEFKAYATRALPHARVIAVESEREFGLSVLRRLDAELTRRGVLFRDASAQDVSAYRAAAAKSGGRLPIDMPRIVLAVDEFQEFFVDDDKLAQDAALLLDRLVRQGRAFGIHLILGSQTLGGAFSIARSTIGQMGVRIALQSSEQDSYLIMSEDNTAPRLLTRPGEAIYNDASGLVEGNSPFQVVWLADARRDAALEHVTTLAHQRNINTPAPIIFEGNLPAEVRNNTALTALFNGKSPPPIPTAWLGDAISIKDPTQIAFHRRGGANAVFVGSDEAAMSAMFSIALVTLAAQTDSSDSARITLINGMAAEGESGVIVDAAAHACSPLIPGCVSRHGPREAAEAVAAVSAEVERRMSLTPEAAEACPPRFLVVYGVQRVRDLRKSDDFSFSASETASPADQFATILREGPNVGVHTLLWCDTVNAIERVLNRQSMREFGWRIVTQMSGNDSTHIIDTPLASSLGRNRALLFSDETAGLEKFRSYSPPTTAWLRHAAASIHSNSTSPDSGDGVSQTLPPAE